MPSFLFWTGADTGDPAIIEAGFSMDEFSSETAAVGKNARASLPLLLSEFLLAIWNQSKDGAVQRRVCVLACLLSICGIAAFIGAVPTRQYGHDIFVLLDNGWACPQRSAPSCRLLQ